MSAAWAGAYVAAIVAVFSFIQAVVALRKLRLDLFARRFEAWETVNDAINTRQAEIAKRDVFAPVTGTTDAQKQIWRSKRLMRALFPHDVTECLTDIEEKLFAYDVANTDIKTIFEVMMNADRDEIFERRSKLEQSINDLSRAQDELLEIVHPYIRQYGWIELAMLKLRRSILPGVAPSIGRLLSRLNRRS